LLPTCLFRLPPAAALLSNSAILCVMPVRKLGKTAGAGQENSN